MPIYTRTGDKGKTALFDGTRVLKSHIRVDTYGTIDELNSSIGVVIAHLKTNCKEVKKELILIQHDLLEIGSGLAMPEGMPVPVIADRPKEFEQLIDIWTQKIPPLKNFILPGGGKAGSFLQVSRTIARRAERQVVFLMQTEEVDESIVKYLNRLSDLLFTASRYVNYKEKKKEIIWKKR